MQNIIKNNGIETLKNIRLQYSTKALFNNALKNDIKNAIITVLNFPDNYGKDEFNQEQSSKNHPGTDVNTNLSITELLSQHIQKICTQKLPESQIVLGEDTMDAYIKYFGTIFHTNFNTQSTRPEDCELDCYLTLQKNNKAKKTFNNLLPAFERRINSVYDTALFCEMINPIDFKKLFDGKNVDEISKTIISILGKDFKVLNLVNYTQTPDEKIEFIYEAFISHVISKKLIDNKILEELNPNIHALPVTTNLCTQRKNETLESIKQLRNLLFDQIKFIKEFSENYCDPKQYANEEDFKKEDKQEFKNKFNKIKLDYKIDDDILDKMYESMYNVKKLLNKSSLEHNDMKVSYYDELKHYLRVFFNYCMKLKDMIFGTQSELVPSSKDLKNDVLENYARLCEETKYQIPRDLLYLI